MYLVAEQGVWREFIDAYKPMCLWTEVKYIEMVKSV